MNICTNNDKCRVLLIEDHPDHAELICKQITLYGKDGFTLCHHASLADGIECIANDAAGPLDIILLDLFLPDSRGLPTLGAVLRDAPDCPVVILTSLSDETLAEKAIEMGAQDYVVKDVILSGGRSLNRIIRYAIARNRNKLKSREQEQKLAQVEAGMQDSKALQLIREVRESLTEMAERGC